MKENEIYHSNSLYEGNYRKLKNEQMYEYYG